MRACLIGSHMCILLTRCTAFAAVACAGRYVLCPGCKSVDTLLDKDSATRLMHLRCQQCGASRTVQAIKSGFVARVTKRQHVG
jgi:hypothetical protein